MQTELKVNHIRKTFVNIPAEVVREYGYKKGQTLKVWQKCNTHKAEIKTVNMVKIITGCKNRHGDYYLRLPIPGGWFSEAESVVAVWSESSVLFY